MNASLILVADDERVIREGLVGLLEGEGFAVATARDGVEAVAKFRQLRPDLVLLDVMMPKANGFKACEAIRQLDALVPVLFLTARDSDIDQVRALGLGADDYLSKGVADGLLIARIRRMLERSTVMEERRTSGRSRKVHLGPITVNLDALTVVEGASEVATLTATEAKILELLDEHRGECLTREDILQRLRGYGMACSESLLYVHISNLRRKLGAAAQLIVNDHHLGYHLVK